MTFEQANETRDITLAARRFLSGVAVRGDCGVAPLSHACWFTEVSCTMVLTNLHLDWMFTDCSRCER